MCYFSLGKIVPKFLWLKKIILIVLYFLFYISSLWGKFLMPNAKSQEPEPEPGAACFFPLGAGAA